MQFDSPTARMRLREHAGYPPSEGRLLEEEVSFDERLLSIRQDAGTSSNRLWDAVWDVVRCLEVLNHEYNGPVPSEKVEGEAEYIHRDVAFSVMSMLLEGEDLRRHLHSVGDHRGAKDVRAALAVMRWAWMGILHGDEDSLRDYAEEQMRWREEQQEGSSS